MGFALLVSCRSELASGGGVRPDGAVDFQGRHPRIPVGHPRLLSFAPFGAGSRGAKVEVVSILSSGTRSGVRGF